MTLLVDASIAVKWLHRDGEARRGRSSRSSLLGTLVETLTPTVPTAGELLLAAEL